MKALQISPCNAASGDTEQVSRYLAADDLSDVSLLEIYQRSTHGGPPSSFRVNMISSIDGAAAGQTGKSGDLSTPGDQRVFEVLRALADVVLVGAETVRTERYTALRTADAFQAFRSRSRSTPSPALAILTNSLDLDFTRLRPSRESGGVMLLCGGTANKHDLSRAINFFGEQSVKVLQSSQNEPHAYWSELTGVLREDFSFDHILCEGGPSVIGQALQAHVVDELCLTSSPLLSGGHDFRIVRGVPLREQLSLAHVLEQDNALFTRWRIERQQNQSIL